MTVGAMTAIALVHVMFGSRSRRFRPHAITAAAALFAAGASFGTLWRYDASPEKSQAAARLCSVFQLLFAQSLVWFVALQARPRRLRVAKALSLGALGLSLLQFVPRISSPSELAATAATVAMVSYVIAGLLHLCTRHKQDPAIRLMLGFMPVVWIAYGYDLVTDYRMLSSPSFAGFASLGLVSILSLRLVHETIPTIQLRREVQICRRRWRSLLEGKRQTNPG